MMTLNYNPMFSEKTLYTFKEVQEIVWHIGTGANFPCTTSDDLLYPLYQCGLMPRYFATNPYNLSFITYEDHSAVVDALVLTLFNKLYARYENHYAIMCDSEETSEKNAKSLDLLKKVFNLIDYSFPKYSILFDLYESKKDHLLDKLQRTRSGNRSMSQSGQNAENSVRLYNDTPQTTDVVATIEGNQYVSDLEKSSVAGSTASSGSDNYQEAENWDEKTIIERLKEIENNYSMLWKNWLDEFDQLFIEEVNFL